MNNDLTPEEKLELIKSIKDNLTIKKLGFFGKLKILVILALFMLAIFSPIILIVWLITK